MCGHPGLLQESLPSSPGCRMSTVDSHAVRRLDRLTSHLTSGGGRNVPKPNVRPGDESTPKVDTSYFVQARPSFAIHCQPAAARSPTWTIAHDLALATYYSLWNRGNSNPLPRRRHWRLTSPRHASKGPCRQDCEEPSFVLGQTPRTTSSTSRTMSSMASDAKASARVRLCIIVMGSESTTCR